MLKLENLTLENKDKSTVINLLISKGFIKVFTNMIQWSYLNFEKSSWKIQLQQTGFLVCKNPFWNWFLQATHAVKIKFD